MKFGLPQLFELTLFLVAAVLAAVYVAKLCIGPINRVAGRLQARTKFQLSDFFWLLIHAQLALAYCVRFVGREQRMFFMLMLGFLTLAITGMWVGSVGCLSRVKVTHPPRRAVFILLTVPLTLALMMTAAIGLILVGFTRLFPIVDLTSPTPIGSMTLHIPYHPFSTTIVLVCVPIAALAIGSLSNWIMRRSEVR